MRNNQSRRCCSGFVFLSKPKKSLLLRSSIGYYASCASVVVLFLTRVRLNSIVLEFYSGSKQKPHNFPNHQKWPPRDHSLQF